MPGDSDDTRMTQSHEADDDATRIGTPHSRGPTDDATQIVTPKPNRPAGDPTRLVPPSETPDNAARRFAGFCIEAEIARGEMGIVYRAKRLSLDRTEALKVIAPRYADDPEYRARFEREAVNAVIADHPHVVKVYDADNRDGRLFIAMQYIDGVDLGELINSHGALPSEAAVEITRQVGSALDAAHANGLVHRDVKPGNILVAGWPTAVHAYLSDFGVSRQIATSGDLTHPGAVVGTPHYTAPEQHLAGAVDHRADVYSLGCVLFEMLTGRKPYPLGSSTAVAIAHCEQAPPSAREVDATILPGLEAVVTRALAKNPADRYQTAGELGDAAAAAVASGEAPDPLTLPIVSLEEDPVDPWDSAETVQHTWPTAPSPATAETTAVAAVTPPTRGDPSPPPSRRRVALPIIAALIAAVVVAIIIAASSSSGGTTHGGTHVHLDPIATWPVYQGANFSTRYPPGWRIVEDNAAKGGGTYFETKFVSANGARMILVDRTPDDAASPEQAAASVRARAGRTRGYRLISFGPATLAGASAWQWVFSLPASGSLTAGPYVDLFRNVSRSRYATLGRAGSVRRSIAVTRRVAALIQAR